MTNGNNGNDLRGEDVSGFNGKIGRNTETPMFGGGSGSNQGFQIGNTETSRNDMGVPATLNLNNGPQKFTGMNFKNWQEKMFLVLSMLGLTSLVKDDPPVMVDNDPHSFNAFVAWEHNDSVWRAYILENLTDAFRNVYQYKETTKYLWESLNQKYSSGDVKAKRSLVKSFLNYTMIDSKTVTSQVLNLCLIVLELCALEMVLTESFLVATIIDKLPPAWSDFKSYLNHKRKDMGVKELYDRLKSQEEEREYLKKLFEGMKVSKKKSKKVQIEMSLRPKGGIAKKQKLGERNHIGAYDIEDIIQDISNMEI